MALENCDEDRSEELSVKRMLSLQISAVFYISSSFCYWNKIKQGSIRLFLWVYHECYRKLTA